MIGAIALQKSLILWGWRSLYRAPINMAIPLSPECNPARADLSRFHAAL